ncbi:MAG: FAD-binding oxidoreductase [Myxococcota bacterium]
MTTDEGVVIPGGRVEHFYAPTSRAGVAQIVSEAARERVGLLIAGGRTRLHWANPAPGISRGLSLANLSGIDQFEPEEGVVHAASGTPIRELQERVNAEGWELALDPPGVGSTLGGTIASAAVGPRSQTFGRVADVILGLDVVGGDGVESKCGGRVVKNVTGYDLAKLYCGSFGSLAVICGAWLRLRPLPAVHEAFVARMTSTREAFESFRSLGHNGAIRALIWSEVPEKGCAELAIEFGGSREAVEHARESVARVIEIDAAPLTHIDSLRDARAAVCTDSIVLRARVLGSETERMMRMILELGLRVSVDPGVGSIHARGSLDRQETLLAIRHQAHAAGGLAIFENFPEKWRSDLDAFDDLAGGASLTAILKSRFDPSGILNPGRFAGRI